MGYRYSAIHNTIIYDANDNDDRIIEDGGRVRVPMTLMDSMQRSIAADSTKVDDDNVTLISRQEMADFDKAQLSARWKGGLALGETFRLGDRNMVVAGTANGKVQLRDASTSTTDAEARQAAYDSYDAEIQSRYLTTHDAKAGESCSTAGREPGTWREKNGRLVCVPGNNKSSKSAEENEWAHAGPLSDAETVQVRDQAYSDYDTQIQNAWKR